MFRKGLLTLAGAGAKCTQPELIKIFGYYLGRWYKTMMSSTKFFHGYDYQAFCHGSNYGQSNETCE
jgi:hypothetical protein